MSASPDGTSATPASPTYDHSCQNGCGRPLDTIVVNLTSGDADFLCRTCAMMMMVAAFRQLVETGAIEDAAPVDAHAQP